MVVVGRDTVVLHLKSSRNLDAYCCGYCFTYKNPNVTFHLRLIRHPHTLYGRMPTAWSVLADSPSGADVQFLSARTKQRFLYAELGKPNIQCTVQGRIERCQSCGSTCNTGRSCGYCFTYKNPNVTFHYRLCSVIMTFWDKLFFNLLLKPSRTSVTHSD